MHRVKWPVSQIDGDVMRIGMVGLGRMGANLARGLVAGGHAVQRDTNDDRAKGGG